MTGIAASMRAYDTFPPRLRKALQTAVGRYSGEQIAHILRQGVPPEEIERHIAREDRARTARDYGRHHPEAHR